MNQKELGQDIRKKVDEFERLCAGINEAVASRAPQGRWSVKEIVSHLIGADGAGTMAQIKVFLDQDVPYIDIVKGRRFADNAPSDAQWASQRATFQELA